MCTTDWDAMQSLSGRCVRRSQRLQKMVTSLLMIAAACVPGWAGERGTPNPFPAVSGSSVNLLADVYPASAYAVSVEGREGLQQALDAHRSVRLMPGDYGPGPVTLRSGQQLYGLPGTKLGRIIIEPGATGSLVSGIQGSVVFPASDKVTRGNTIFRLHGTVLVQGGTLEDNLFLDTRALDVDVTASGYLRNNRFIRAPGQLQGNSMLKFRANPERPSTGNVFLWVNSGGNDGPTTDIVGVPDLTIAVVDAEMWSWKVKDPIALFSTGPMQRLNLFAVQGGRYDKDLEVLNNHSLIDSAAREVRVFGLTCGYRGEAPDTLPPKIILREGNERSLFTDLLHYSYSIPLSNKLNVRAFEQPLGKPEAGQPIAIAPAGAERTQQAALKEMILQTGRQMCPWEIPSFNPIPNPAGDAWVKDAATAPDQTQMLQDRLDKEGMVVLPPGKYYISAPLRINTDKGLIGAGMERTVIIAKNPNLSMFVYDAQGKTRSVTLANLTLQGGRVGVHLKGEDVGDHPLSHSFLSHITFRNMSEAGVFVDMPAEGASSFDNNLISYCNFVKCGAGLKQSKSTPRQGVHIWGFIDKLVLYRCQFLQCGVGIDFPATRANNACSYIECLFKGNTEAAAKLVHNTTPSFAKCDLIDNAGDPLVASDSTAYFISCRFQAGAGAQSLLPSQSCAEGCVFESGSLTGAVIVKKPAPNRFSQNHFYNCRAKMPIGHLDNGLLLNNLFANNPDLSQVASYVFGGKVSVLVPGMPQPGPQLLVTGINKPGK